MGTELIAIGGLLTIVGGMGVWFADGLAEYDRKTGYLGVTWYETLEAERWRIVLYRLTFSAVAVLGALTLVLGVVTALR